MVPPAGRQHVIRSRIDQALDAAIDAALVLVSAPAGSGKSTALGGWLRRRGGGGWYALDTEDNDPAVFWPSMAAAAGLHDIESANPRAVARALFDAPSAEPTVVVLDDYHVITNTAIHAGVDQFLTEAPALLRLVVSTRHDPPLMLSRLRVQGGLCELRYDDLRFGAEDIDAILRHAGVELPPMRLPQLVERTEGWAAAVQLIGLSLRGHDDPLEVVDTFSGDNRHLADYLRDEVIAGLPSDLRTFLLDTAILDRLTAPLCEAVAGVSDAQTVLAELERRNLFLLPLDTRRRWFRYHHLFAEWLRMQDRGGRAKHRAAADWLLANGYVGDAIRHLIEAGEPERAADAIDDTRWALVGSGREETLRDWVQRLPPEVRRARTGLTLAAAWVAHHAGRWNDVRDLAASVAPEDALMEAEVVLLEAGRLIAVGDAAAALAATQAGLALVPEDEPRGRTGLLLVQGRALLAQGDLNGSARSFAEAVRLAEQWNVTIVRLIARSHLAEIHRREGRRAEARAEARAALELAERERLNEHPEATVANLTLAELLLDEGRIDEATVHTERGADLAARVPYVPRQEQLRAVRERLDGFGPRGRKSTRSMVEQLTGRELSVLRLLPSRLTPREIAAELYLSLNTIKSHTRSIYRKLGVQSRHEAIEAARSLGVL